MEAQTQAGSAIGVAVARRKQGDFSLLHLDPVILYAKDEEILNSTSALWSVLEALPARSAHLILGPTWTFHSRRKREQHAAQIRSLSGRIPHLATVSICPTAGEAAALRTEGVDALHCSEAALIGDDLFAPIPGRQPIFDAIYDARWADYKRHELAGRVRSLALIAQPPWRPERGCTVEYLQQAHHAVRHATWFSVPWGSTNLRWISYAQINAAYSQARVGLCLSREEGHMAASIQYLLAGLPVVTTPNHGGRDEFFDPAYVRWVEPEATAVANGVDELASLDLDPQTIRQSTLVRIREHRQRLQAWIQATIRADGGEPGRWGDAWPSTLPNKLREPQARAAEVIDEIAQSSRRRFTDPLRGAAPARHAVPDTGPSHGPSHPPTALGTSPSPPRERGQFSLLHVDPVILSAWEPELRRPDAGLWAVLEGVRDRRTHLIVSPSFTLISQRYSDRLARLIAELSERFNHVVFAVNCATAAETAVMRGHGIDAVHCSTGALIREDVFKPPKDRQPRFDAIYDAKLVEWKRHELAARVPSLALIAAAGEPNAQFTISYLTRVHTALRHATWLVSPWGEKRWMSYWDVSAAYSEARVGLCLSATEGHMNASIQYLLAGLPVVATPSIGGRNEFFAPEYVRWVDADPGAVARAVDELISLDLDPQMIREATLTKVRRHRDRLQAWIRQVIEAEGGEPGRWAGSWPDGLRNKLREPTPRTADVLAELEHARSAA